MMEPPPPPNSLFAISPACLSFNSYSSDTLDRLVREPDDEAPETTASRPATQGSEEEEQGKDGGEFEFEFGGTTSPISADDIFYNGQIRPIYPLFNLFPDSQSLLSNLQPPPHEVKSTARGRRPALWMLFREEEEEDRYGCGNASSSDELESVPEGTYCVWTPKKEVPPWAEACKKSNSTGTFSKRWKFRDLLYRSSSDGRNDSFVFPAPGGDTKKVDGGGRRRQDAGGEKGLKERGDGYLRNEALMKEGEKRRTFLPYRQPDAVGIFSNVSRNLHPF